LAAKAEVKRQPGCMSYQASKILKVAWKCSPS